MSLKAITLVQNIQLPNAVAAQYTCPTNSLVIVRHVVFTNTTAGAITVTAEIVPNGGSTGAAAQILSALSIAGNTAYVSPEFSGVVLNAGDTIQCFASGAASISMNASGIQQT
jgi:hypothetical protein